MTQTLKLVSQIASSKLSILLLKLKNFRLLLTNDVSHRFQLLDKIEQWSLSYVMFEFN